MKACFHCGEPVPAGIDIHVNINGQAQTMCCQGCAAVAELLNHGGLSAFYRARDGVSSRPEPRDGDWWRPFDRPSVLDSCAEGISEGVYRIQLRISQVRCAACVWLIESLLESEPGVQSITVNPATGLADLQWTQKQTPLSSLLRRLDRLGYPARPAEAAAAERPAEERAALRRLIVAGIGLLQVMMYAVGLYLGDFSDMLTATRDYLRWVALLLTTPVVFYSGWPFLTGAWRCLGYRRLTMELPIGLAIAIAWSASLFNTFSGQGEVYFDSAVMFVFFMTVVRWVDLRSRNRALNTTERLAADLPAVVRRLVAGRAHPVARGEIEPGDHVLVETGEQVPADGRLLEGSAELDESLLTGEFEPQRRQAGDRVLAGSLVLEGPLVFEVRRVSRDTLLSGIARLMRQAAARRTTGSVLMTRIASVFLGVILVLAAFTYGFWWLHQPERALDVLLALLVVTCPCALSLAIPVAQAAAQTRLARAGILLTRPGVLEDLAGIDLLLTDKTGTLTEGKPGIRRVRTLADLGRDEVLAVCRALETGSTHPLARAFHHHGDQCQPLPARAVREVSGKGIEGVVDGRKYRLGRPDFALDGESRTDLSKTSGLLLADSDGPLAVIELEDAIRHDARPVLAELGWPAIILSGDEAASVAAVAGALDIEQWHAGLSPADKLDYLHALQSSAHRVLAVGDGVNDAPLLAGADIGVAIGVAGALARTRADVVVPGTRFSALRTLVQTGQYCRRIVRQNLIWALCYNLVAIPAAVAGLVPPWLAAAGMSLSSVGVVLNSLRLARDERGSRQQTSRPDATIQSPSVEMPV